MTQVLNEKIEEQAEHFSTNFRGTTLFSSVLPGLHIWFAVLYFVNGKIQKKRITRAKVNIFDNNLTNRKQKRTFCCFCNDGVVGVCKKSAIEPFKHIS